MENFEIVSRPYSVGSVIVDLDETDVISLDGFETAYELDGFSPSRIG